MILHGTWDFASFTGSSDAFKESEQLVDPRANPVPILLLVLMLVLFAIGYKEAFGDHDATRSPAAA